MKSMTGYGKGIKNIGEKNLTIELKSVNNRFLDVNIKLPKQFIFLEDALRKEVQSVVKRGRIDVFVTYEDLTLSSKQITIDKALAKAYIDAAKELNDEFGLTNDYSVSQLMKVADIIKLSATVDDEKTLEELALGALRIALEKHLEMRAIEGIALREDILIRISNIKEMVLKIKDISPLILSEYRTKMENRMKEILTSVQVDDAKLLNEVAFFADKINVDEEIARLLSHIGQVCNIVRDDDLAGRKLDFIVQELNREANTICSKSNNVLITNIGLELKSEIEKIREQVQNIE